MPLALKVGRPSAREIAGIRLMAFGPSTLGEDLFKLASRFAPAALVPPVVGPNDIMRMGYSGGTTGKPKALPSCQRTAVVTLQIMLSDWEWPNPPHVLSCAPLSHAGGAMFMPALLRGGTMLVLPGFEPVAVMQAIERYRINCMLLVPTMIYALLDHPRLNEFDLSSLQTVFYGASAISPARLKEAIERIGRVFCQFYGQAEAPMAITMLRKSEHDVSDLRRLASCGRPSPWVRVQLQDVQGQRLRRRAGRDLRARSAGDGRLSRFAADERGLSRWLAAYRRCRGARSGWVPAHRGSYQGHDRLRWLQHLSARDRGHHRGTCCCLAGSGDRRGGQKMGRSGQGAGGIETRSERDRRAADCNGRRSQGLVSSAEDGRVSRSIPQTAVGKPDKKALRARYAQPER